VQKKRVFIAFAAPEDSYARDFLVGQARNKDSPIEFVDMSVKEPWSESWKTRCRIKIKGCHGLIALLSKHTIRATGALWEIKCGAAEGLPVLGVHIHKEDKGPIPAELVGRSVINWSWDGIANFIDRL
jgi:hypothetical protein